MQYKIEAAVIGGVSGSVTSHSGSARQLQLSAPAHWHPDARTLTVSATAATAAVERAHHTRTPATAAPATTPHGPPPGPMVCVCVASKKCARWPAKAAATAPGGTAGQAAPTRRRALCSQRASASASHSETFEPSAAAGCEQAAAPAGAPRTPRTERQLAANRTFPHRRASSPRLHRARPPAGNGSAGAARANAIMACGANAVASLSGPGAQPVYLVDFSVYKPPEELKLNRDVCDDKGKAW